MVLLEQAMAPFTQPHHSLMAALVAVAALVAAHLDGAKVDLVVVVDTVNIMVVVVVDIRVVVVVEVMASRRTKMVAVVVVPGHRA